MFYAIFGAVAGLIGGVFIMFVLSVIRSNRARRRKAKARAAAETEIKRKVEFSKILAGWAAFVATAIVAASVALAAFDKQPVSDLAIAVFTACIGYLITYAGKSAFEKSSRNKYHLDEDGKPFDGYSDDTEG